MADPISIGLGGSMLATAIGGGISTFGALQGGSAALAARTYQAGIDKQLANVALLKSNRDIMAGEQEAQKYGIRTSQIRGGFTAGAGARNVGMGGSTGQVLRSQLAAGREEQATARQTAAERAYGERVEAAAKTASAGAQILAGQQEKQASYIAAASSVVSAGGAVSGKWYDVSKFGDPGFGDQLQDALQDIQEG